MKIQTGQTLLFIGDSITDCGRRRPVAADWGFGDGYVHLVNSLLMAFQPQRTIRIINTGVSGDRVVDLEARWQSDVLDLAPDWMSIMIGINDVWRFFDRATDPDKVDSERYEATYRRLLDRTRPTLDGLVLMTPFFLEANAADPMRAQMDAYGAIVKQLAQDYDATFVDVQAAFNDYLAHRPTQSLCADRVHPNQVGHLIIARAFLNGIDFDWSAATP